MCAARCAMRAACAQRVVVSRGDGHVRNALSWGRACVNALSHAGGFVRNALCRGGGPVRNALCYGGRPCAQRVVGRERAGTCQARFFFGNFFLLSFTKTYMLAGLL